MHFPFAKEFFCFKTFYAWLGNFFFVSFASENISFYLLTLHSVDRARIKCVHVLTQTLWSVDVCLTNGMNALENTNVYEDTYLRNKVHV